MSTITFRGATIRYADLRIKEEAGVFARLHMTSDMSEPVSAAMEWEAIPACTDSAKLSGGLTSRTLILTPSDKALRSHEINIECSEVGDFQFFRVKGDDNGPGRSELRFIARSNQPGAIALIENYLRLAGQAPGALKITYDDQQKLAFDGEKKTNAEESEANCPDCANDVGFMANDDAVHVTGQKCRKWVEPAATEAPLASAAGLGGTHQKRKGKASAGVQ